MPAISALLLLAALSAAPIPAQEPSAHAPKPGERWALLRIDVDAKGRPVRCRIKETNLYRSSRFWACHGYMKNWRTQRLTDAGRPTTVEQMYIVPLGGD